MANPKIQLRHDTSTNWQTQNPVLLEGEVAIETDSNKVKIGNGTDNYNTLPYITDQTKINLDYSNADYQPVNKAGDTMTGNLIVSTDSIDNWNIALKNTNQTLSNIPSTNTFTSLAFTDNNNNALGRVLLRDTSTGREMRLRVDGYGNNINDSFTIGYDTSDVVYCSFPNTTCCDGQWTALNQNVINSATSANGSTYLGPYTINVPNDGHNYELLIEGQISTGSTIGNWVLLTIRTTVTAITCAQVIAQRAVQTGNSGSCIIPITADRKLWVGRSTSQNGDIQKVKVVAYRRIGTNS